MDINPTLAVGSVRMPHDAAAESTVLSAMMMSEDAFAEAVASLSEEDFFDWANRRIFGTMRAMSETHPSLDPVGLADALRTSGDLGKVGGMDRLLDLSNDILAVQSWETSTEILRRDRTLRDMITASSAIMAMASDSPGDVREVIERAEGLLLAASEGRLRESGSSMREMMDELYEGLCEQAGSGSEQGVRTGFSGLDGRLLGLRSGQMVVIGARPGVGKTSLCLNLATNMARNGTTVAMFSLEMSREEIAQRLLSTRSGIALTDIRSANIRAEEWQTVIDSISELRELPIMVDDAPGTTVTEIHAKARRMLRGVEDAVVIIDYLQLMSGGSRTDSRATAVGEMSRGIKVMAKELGVPVIALSQLNREVEGRNGKRPQLSDLRESGSIEQDADIVLLLDRSMTPEEAERKDRPDEGVTHLIVAKNRSGPLGTIELRFDGSTTRFLEISKEEAW